MEMFKDEIPDKVSKDAQDLFYALVAGNLEVVKEAEANGVKENEIISMVVSSLVTLLVNKMECSHCTAELLADVVVGLQLSHNKEKGDDVQVH